MPRHIVVTVGMPVLLYRWYFGAYGVRGFERSMLSFAGIKPIRESFYGLTFADANKRALARRPGAARCARRLIRILTPNVRLNASPSLFGFPVVKMLPRSIAR